MCGPVDCTTVTSITSTPEFTVTEVGGGAHCDASEGEEALACNSEDEAQGKTTSNAIGLDVHRSSLTGLLAQGIKRVNSANNLAIPGIVSSLAGGTSGGGGGSNNIANAKSLPPSPQHSPSRYVKNYFIILCYLLKKAFYL